SCEVRPCDRGRAQRKCRGAKASRRRSGGPGLGRTGRLTKASCCRGRSSPMLHHERLRPPLRDYPPDEWKIIEKAFHPEFLPQLKTIFAVGKGYLGMRGCPEEGGPNAENGTFINGFYETWPIVYGEEAYGFAKTGQTICNVTDSKTIKLFVDDEPFW